MGVHGKEAKHINSCPQRISLEPPYSPGALVTVGTTPVASDDELAERYGRGPRDRRRTRWWFAGTAVAFALVFGAWLWWGGLSSPGAELEARDAGYQVHDDSSVTVRWNLTVDPGMPTSCALQALNSRFGVVGWKVIEVPPSDARTRTLTEDLRTTELAETGLIYRCWLT
jgi:hypothetical protein